MDHTRKYPDIIALLKKLPGGLLHVVLNFPHFTKKSAITIFTFLNFFAILLIFMVSKLISVITHIPGLNIIVSKIAPIFSVHVQPLIQRVINLLESQRPFKVKRSYLIYMAYENLRTRSSRSLITIFGMSIGVAIIVYLLSLGYGIERLVISQVASLNELKMIDVTPGESSRTVLNEQILKRIEKIPSVANTVPLVSVVGKLNYKNAKTDIVVYSVPHEYLTSTKPRLVGGKYFSKKFTRASALSNAGQVAGAETELKKGTFGKPVVDGSIQFNLLPNVHVPVWTDCSMKSELLGVTLRSDSDISGVEFWGGEYAPFDPFGRAGIDRTSKQFLGVWIKAQFPLYKEIDDNTVDKVYDETSAQQWVQGCVQRVDTQITDARQFTGSVLGESTVSFVLSASDSATLDATGSAQLEASNSATISGVDFADSTVATNEAGVEVVYLQNSQKQEKKEQTVVFSKPVSGELVISSGLLNLLNIDRRNFEKESIKLAFIIVKSLVPKATGRIVSEEAEYKIVGIVDDDESQFVYVPLQDVAVLGVSNYSQAKVELKDTKEMPKVRKEIETMGYKTASTADTVSQIESFFTTVRGVLGILGFIALGVASLGMFNTLTVSLLERTREIGGMKTMGMVSGEIQELFLAEAMIMGFAGGLGGLIIGALGGKITSSLVSFVAVSQGLGFLDLTFIPFGLILFIVASSFVVGVATGLYPAYRAKKTSALNALRYE